MSPHIPDPFQGISPGFTDGAVWKAFGLVFNDMNLTFSVLSVDPLTLAAYGDASFDLYAAGISSDRYPDQAKLFVVRLIQSCVAHYTDARFRQRFGREPVLGDSSSGDPMSSLSGLLAAVQATVRNDISAYFSIPVTEQPLDPVTGATTVARPTDKMLQKAIKYVFGDGQMGWTLATAEGTASILPCYKFAKARSDAGAEHPEDRARAAVVGVVDGLLSSNRPEIVAAIKNGKLSKAVLRQHIEELFEEDIGLFRFERDDIAGHPEGVESSTGGSQVGASLADQLLQDLCRMEEQHPDSC